jgi:protein LSM14
VAAASSGPQNGSAGQTHLGAKGTPTGPRNHNRVTPVIPLASVASNKASQSAYAEDKSGHAKATVTAPQNSVQDATNAARAAVAVAMAQLGNSGGNAMDNLTKKVNEMRVNAVANPNPNPNPNVGRGGVQNRGRGRGGRPAGSKVEVPDSDFDFATSNAKFNKGDVVKEAIAGSPLTETAPAGPVEAEPAALTNAGTAYNKTTSFFDNISSEARERAENGGQKPGGREWRGEEQRKNMETFGQGSVDGGYRNYRGRGRGRGGGGRGGPRGGYNNNNNRGGRGGNRQQYQPMEQS